MAVSLTINGTSYTFPSTGDETWGDNVTNWATAVSSSLLQKTGGTFTLTADVDFGASFGLKSTYFKTRTANLATAGVVRLAVADTISWRNNANGANLALGVNASDQLTFNSTVLLTTAGVLSASRAVVTDGSAALITATTTATEIGYVNGVTSAIQTQLNTKITVSSADTLTNKKLTDANCTFVDDGDATKQLAFQCSGITTATTRTWTVPDVSDTLVGLAATQTLTAKTLTSPVVTGLNLAVSAVKTTTYTATATDDFIPVTTASGWTLTLPAASASKKVLTIRKGSTDLNVLTISRAGSDTIVNYATGLTSTTLNTMGETIELQSDGTSVWYVTRRYIPSEITSYTPGSYQGFGTPTSVNMTYFRVGDSLYLQGSFVAGTVTAAEARVALPTGLTSAGVSKIPAIRVCGHTATTETNQTESVLIEPSATYITFGREAWAGGASPPITKEVVNNFLGSSDTFQMFTGPIPITGWNG